MVFEYFLAARATRGPHIQSERSESRAVMLMRSFLPSFNGSKHSVDVKEFILLVVLGQAHQKQASYNRYVTYNLTVLDSINPVDPDPELRLKRGGCCAVFFTWT